MGFSSGTPIDLSSPSSSYSGPLTSDDDIARMRRNAQLMFDRDSWLEYAKREEQNAAKLAIVMKALLVAKAAGDVSLLGLSLMPTPVGSVAKVVVGVQRADDIKDAISSIVEAAQAL